MSFDPGVRLGPFEIVSAIGAGGMGEVYRARDTRLQRDVAIKVLPAAFSSDPERLARFEQEARAAAALNHPNILAVHDIGTHEGAPYIVSELLEGESLRDRLAHGALPVRKAIEYAVQIAHGLAAAHEKGIVHRDLKPENVFVTSDGRVKILDFGLAKLTQAEPALGGMSVLPTGMPDTLPGVVLGTLGYMAPEQVRGQAADHRADIFAFGAILYEMLAGQRAFRGDTTADTMTAILKEDPPDLPAAERHIPAALARIVDRCLEKNPAARFQSMRDLAFALEGLSSQSHVEEMPAAPRRRSKALLVSWTSTVVACGVAAVAIGVLYLRGAPSEAPSVRFAIAPPQNVLLSTSTRLMASVISPDGRRVVFIAARAGATAQLWIRSLGDLEARPLPGTPTETPSYPFWSPDSRTIGFFAGGKLKTIDVDGGQVQSLCDAPAAMGGTWSRDGVIVFAALAAGGLLRIPATGGQPSAVTTVSAASRQISHRFPAFLPDGRHFIFLVWPSNTIWIGSLDSGETKQLLSSDSQAEYAAPGFILFTRQGTLVAQRFDDRGGTVGGDAVPLAQQVTRDANGHAPFSASAGGMLAYRTGAAAARTQLTWFDRSGASQGRLGQQGFYRNPVLAPDGARVALELVDPQGRNQDIWIGDVGRGVMTRFTFDPHNDIYPVWSADGTRIMFASDRDGGVFNVYQKAANGATDEQLLVKSADDMAPYTRSPDGRYLLYRLNTTGLGILPLTGDRKQRPLLQAVFTQSQGQVSPDGRWLAYVSNESGPYEVYIRSFPDLTGKWQVSQGGAVHPRWRGDGKELYYYASDGRLMAVPIKGDTAAEIGTAAPLFGPRLLNGPNVSTGFRAQYDVTPDGRRFLLNVPLEEDAPSPITVVLNWTAALKK